jgi:hypothetical protein
VVSWKLVETRVRCPPDLLTALSLLTLSHELYHKRGYLDEAQTDCYAFQTVASLAYRLGATTAAARGYARIAWEFLRPQRPADYQSADCYDGGPWDIDPRPGWPVP